MGNHQGRGVPIPPPTRGMWTTQRVDTQAALPLPLPLPRPGEREMKNKETVIQFAVQRLNEESQRKNSDVAYWAAYLDGAKAQLRECERKVCHDN